MFCLTYRHNFKVTMNELPQFNIFDIIVLLYFLFGLYQGLRRGLSGELASVLSTTSPLSPARAGISQ